jgi:hypothetical protein
LRHDDELAVFCRVKHPPKFLILDGETLDVLHKSFHNDSSFVLPDGGVRCHSARISILHAALASATTFFGSVATLKTVTEEAPSGTLGRSLRQPDRTKIADWLAEES